MVCCVCGFSLTRPSVPDYTEGHKNLLYCPWALCPKIKLTDLLVVVVLYFLYVILCIAF